MKENNEGRENEIDRRGKDKVQWEWMKEKTGRLTGCLKHGRKSDDGKGTAGGVYDLGVKEKKMETECKVIFSHF